MSRILAVALISLLSFNSQAANEWNDSIKIVASDYSKAKKFETPAEVTAFLQKKIKEGDVKSFPKMEVVSNDTIKFEFAHQVLQVVFLPEYKLKVNGKILDLTKAESLDEQWKMVIDALPQKQKTSMLELFVQKAHAEDDERLTGGLFLGTGAAAIATAMFSPVVAGVVVIGAAYAIWNNGTCITMGKEKYECLKFKEETDERIEKNKKIAGFWKARKPRPSCKASGNNDVYEKLNDLIGNNNELFRGIVTCRKTKNELKQCLSNLSLDAYYMCVKTHGLTDKYLPPWARSGEGEEESGKAAH